MSSNFLQANSDKTEAILLGQKHLRNTLFNDIVTLGVIALASSTTVRNLGNNFDQDMSIKDNKL